VLRRQFANVAIVRFDAPMFFANVKHFEEMLAQIARRDPRPFAIVVDCSAITSWYGICTERCRS
jgi:MFS superfamily sulfate permease-like transporter